MADEQVPIHILHLEDSQLDAELLCERLIDVGLPVRINLVTNQADFTEQIRNGSYDLVISDYNLPGFNALQALEITRSTCPDMPFICISGAIGEEKVAELFRRGATDYVPKSRLDNLHLIIQRAWDEVRERISRSRAEEALKVSELKYRLLFDNASDAILILGESGQILEANAVACARLGYSREELVSLKLTDIDVPEEHRHMAEQHAGFKDEDHFTLETIHRRLDGTLIPTEVNGRKVIWEGRTAIMAIARDISERRKAEAERREMERQIYQTQKLESLGILAGGIAHDFNNILTSIIGNADLVLMRLDAASPFRNNLQQIDKAAQRASDLARQMLAYSGRGMFTIESVNINHLVEEMAKLLEVSISKKVELLFNPCADLPLVNVDLTQLRQVIMNLVINASEAIGDSSGTITLNTGAMRCESGHFRDSCMNEEVAEGDYVYLEVADTGCGMDSDTASRIFDPFFTTKFTGRGLGMAAVLGIVRGHKGAIAMSSQPGAGTTFRVYIPAAGEAARPPARKIEETGSDWKGSGTVLLVDDEDILISIASELLGELGFDVITAGDGLEALEAFRQNVDRICCVLLDLTMPNMDGEQCFRELSAFRPDVKVIISSGYSEQEVAGRFSGKGLVGFVQKPYTLSVLRTALRAVLGTPDGGGT